MRRVERERDVFPQPVDEAQLTAHLAERARAGWQPAAIEWRREITADTAVPAPGTIATVAIDTPFGLRVASDCEHLEENESELSVLLAITELIVQDRRLTQVADELNRRGLRTRTGNLWSPVSVFNLLPRLIEVAPRIFSSDQWTTVRDQIFRSA